MANKSKTKVLKYLFLIFVLAMIGWFLGRNLAEIQTSFDTTVSSITGTILIAALVLIFSQWMYVIVYRRAFSVTGAKYGLREMLKLQLSAQAVNMIIPSAGAAGIMIFADDAKEKGRSRASAVIGYLMFIISEFSAISILLLASIIYLLVIRSLGARVYLPAGIFVLITIGYYYLLLAAGRPTGVAKRFVVWVVKLAESLLTRVFKRGFKAEGVVDRLDIELSATNETIRKNPKTLISLIGIQLVVHLLRVVALFLIFSSLGYDISPNILLAGYSIGVVLTVVSPTPSGVGFVEGGMYLMYTSLGVPGTVASTATIIYRFLQFWLPLFVGLVLLQQNRIKKIRNEVEELENER